VGEVFGVWNIEGPAWLEEQLPFKKAGVNCIVVPDVTPYKKRKVRILNGAHTGFVLGAYLGGYDIVRDSMHDESILGYMNKMLFEEILPILPLPKEDVESFAAAVQDRFNNPFINHELMSISLNSTSKWRARNMPSFLEYMEKFGKLPTCLIMSFAAYIAFFSNEIQELNEAGLVCRRPKGNCYTCIDDSWVLEFYWEHRNDSAEDLVQAIKRVCSVGDINASHALIYNERQRHLTMKATNCISEAIEALYMGLTLDAVTVLIEEAIGFLCELTGERVTDEVVDKVFHQFCVGK
jgi:tagaturonate reductase